MIKVSIYSSTHFLSRFYKLIKHTLLRRNGTSYRERGESRTGLSLLGPLTRSDVDMDSARKCIMGDQGITAKPKGSYGGTRGDLTFMMAEAGDNEIVVVRREQWR